MATTLTLQNSINFVLPILKNQPVLVSNQEPALTSGNIILGRMLGPPFSWRFNRALLSFAVTQAGGTDYVVNLANYGFLETQWLAASSGAVFELGGEVALAQDSRIARPTKLADQFDNNQGQITFRLDRVPDANYTVYGNFQQKATLMTSAASNWGVVPDEFQYIFNLGFLCLTSLLVNDARFPIFEQYFISSLLAAQDSLDERKKNIFLGNWVSTVKQIERAQGNTKSGIEGRTK